MLLAAAKMRLSEVVRPIDITGAPQTEADFGILTEF
jgi:hypothetical protein